MGLTQPVDWLQEKHVGYVVNAEFSAENKKKLVDLMQSMEAKFGDAVFVMPEVSLHVTLMDWIAPLVDYEGQNKDELFTRI